jgi:hypothetical protein
VDSKVLVTSAPQKQPPADSHCLRGWMCLAASRSIVLGIGKNHCP